MASYVTLDPINAKFIAKSSIPLRRVQSRDKSLTREEKLSKDEGGISYLNFSVSGELLDKKYGILFSNTSLNSGVSIAGQYNFRLKKPAFAYDDGKWTKISLERDRMLGKYNAKRDELKKKYSFNNVVRNENITVLRIESENQKLRKSYVKYDIIQKKIDSLGVNNKSAHSYGDTLSKLAKEFLDIEKSIGDLQSSLDSIRSLKKEDLEGQLDVLTNDMFDKLKRDYDTLFTTASLERIKLNWFTILAAYDRLAYNTFDDSLPFDQQLGKSKLNSFNFGFSYNYLLQDKLGKRTFFLNLSLIRKKTNNLSNLTASNVEDRRQYTGTMVGQTRSLGSKVSAYIDPVVSTEATNFSLHGYFLFGKSTTGFHLFPSIDFRDDGVNVSDVTFGYLLSFRNSEKEKTVINSELYFRLNDIFNGQKAEERVLNRNEIGISFSVPFNIF